MKPRDVAIALGLVALALFIWLRDRAWLTAVEDVLPALAALPILYWLGIPWMLRAPAEPVALGWASVGLAAFFLGLLLNLTVALALGWTFFLWSFLSPRLAPGNRRMVGRLMPLAFLAFPWIQLDGEGLSWTFRLSGAWTAGKLFQLLGREVVQQGAELGLDGVGLEVNAACSGISTLQSMLVAGTMLAFLLLGASRLYWLTPPLLAGLAWVANTARIFAIGLLALLGGPELAKGFFHDWGGWLVLVLMFLVCWGIFTLMAMWAHPEPEAAEHATTA